MIFDPEFWNEYFCEEHVKFKDKNKTICFNCIAKEYNGIDTNYLLRFFVENVNFTKENLGFSLKTSILLMKIEVFR